MPGQLRTGFFAYARTFEINVDKEKLEGAKWHSREDLRKALTFAEYKKAQLTAAAKIEQTCKGVEKARTYLQISMSKKWGTCYYVYTWPLQLLII